MSKINSWYDGIMARWLTAESGPKPTAENFRVAEAFKRGPGLEALHVVMCLRPKGCTVRQFLVAGSCGPANNTRRALVAEGMFTQAVEGKPYAFMLTLTPKGTKAVAAHYAATDAAAVTDKPKASAKGDKAKPKVKRASKPRTARVTPPAETTAPAVMTSPAAEAPQPQA